MDSREYESQLLVDCETLRRVIPGLDRLESQWAALSFLWSNVTKGVHA